MRFEFKFYKHWSSFGVGVSVEATGFCSDDGSERLGTGYSLRAHAAFWSMSIHYWPTEDAHEQR